MTVTVRAVKVLSSFALLALAAGCSREQQDWRAAEAADSPKAYGQFIESHPESELVTQARVRLAQLGEDQDWQSAATADSAGAYKQFLTQHPSGKWAQEARIRIESFALAAQTGSGPTPQHAVLSESAAHSVQPMGQRSAEVEPPPSSPRVAAGSSAPALVPASAPAIAVGSPSAAVSGTTTSTGARYGVQLGAFATQAAADNQWHVLSSRFAPELASLSPHVIAASTDSGTLYRLQATVPDEPRARALCGTLKQQGQGCVPVLPR